MRLLTVASVVAALAPAFAASDVIIPPKTSHGRAAALVIVQGAQIDAEAYAPLAAAIQEACNVDLYVGVPQMWLSTPEPLVLPGALSRIEERLAAAGMPKDAPVFYAGHSLGGVMLQDYLHNFATPSAGQILLGSFMTRKWREETTPYRVPTLTVGAELDGLARISRFAEAFFHQVGGVSSAQPRAGAQRYPVVVIDGMSHMQFASGEPPLLVKSRDLRPEIAQADAQRAVAAAVAAFMHVQLGIDGAQATLDALVASTGRALEPLILAMEMEGSAHIKAPCNDAPLSEACLLGSPWVKQFAQPIMAGLQGGGKVEVRDEFHPVWQIPFHLPKITNNCTQEQGCVLDAHTVTQNVNEDLDKLDTGFASISASTMRVKMNSRQRVWQSAGHLAAKFEDTDGSNICASINQAAIDWATMTASTRAIGRYKRVGEPITVGDDQGPFNVGPLWIWQDLDYKREADAQGASKLVIRSPMMKTPTDYAIQSAAGFHYCKLLSPFRAMEWVYTDSLRARMALSDEGASAGLPGPSDPKQ